MAKNYTPDTNLANAVGEYYAKQRINELQDDSSIKALSQ